MAESESERFQSYVTIGESFTEIPRCRKGSHDSNIRGGTGEKACFWHGRMRHYHAGEHGVGHEI